MSGTRIEAGLLIDFVEKVFASVGVPEKDAKLIADTHVQADLWGHQSHGGFARTLVHGAPEIWRHASLTEPKLVVDSGSIAVLDGCDGVGQVLMARTGGEAVGCAKVHCVGAVGVRDSKHLGTAMYLRNL